MNPTVTAERMAAFAQLLQNEERSEATVEKYMRDIRHFAAFVGTGELCRQTVMNYKRHLGDTYAVASANSMIAALNVFLRFCGRHELCVKQFRTQRIAFCSEDKELSRAEYMRLLEAARRKCNRRLYLILQTICATGIRVSELSYITVESLASGVACVRCKGKNRRIFIVAQLKKKLLRYAKDQRLTTGAVFVTKNGKPVSRHTIWRDMKSLCAAADVAPSKVFPHNLRHLFARTFYRLEKDIAKLADILGHASINTTRIYIVTTGSEHRQCMEHMHLLM